MAEQNIQIKDLSGNLLYPKTKASIVINNANKNLGGVEENAYIIACVIFTIVQMNYFATKLDVANLKIELMEYSQKHIELSENKIDKKLDAITKK